MKILSTACEGRMKAGTIYKVSQTFFWVLQEGTLSPAYLHPECQHATHRRLDLGVRLGILPESWVRGRSLFKEVRIQA